MPSQLPWFRLEHLGSHQECGSFPEEFFSVCRRSLNFRSAGHREAFGDKYPALRGPLPDRLDRLIGRRVVPFTRFLRAVECDHHDALWCFALESLGLAPTDDIVVIERRDRLRHLLPIL